MMALLASLPVVPVEGTVRLLDVGLYRVSYRLGSGPIVNLGLGWQGHFEPVAGVSYTPWSDQDGVRTLLIHCPWRRGGGLTWVDYRFRLPKGVKVKFVFGCAMWRNPDVQKGSDGVTYAVYIDGKERFRKHITSPEWEWHEIDLSDLAGKEFTLRLEVGPGPRNDPSWDYSLWGDPKIVVEGAKVRPKLPKVRKSSLEDLSNNHKLGVRPSVHHRYKNSARKAEGGAFEFSYLGEDCKILYIVRPKAGLFPAEVEVRVDDQLPFYAYGGGYVQGPKGRAEVTKVSVKSFDRGRLVLGYSLEYAGERHSAEGAFWIEGKTLFCEFRTFEGWASEVNFGHPLAQLKRTVRVPYLFATGIFYLPAQAVFCSVFLDFLKSEASYLQPTASIYEQKTDGTRNPVHDVCLFTVSYEFPEVLRNIPWEPSPYLDLIGDRIVFDIWGGRYAEGAEWIRELAAAYGVRKAILLWHVWQRYGYDSHLPTTVPCDPRLGTEEDMLSLSRACREAGWLFALHENYIDFYPLSHEWNPKEVALYPNGKWRKAWFNRATGEQSYAYKNWAMAKYARKYSPEIHRRYKTTACYYDVNPCTPPWLHLDCDAKEPNAAKFRGRLEGNIELFKVGRESHEGPLFGEGEGHFWWAGLVDGVEAQLISAGKEYAPWLLDFDLLKIHPQMVNHGMGYWSRWIVDPESWRGLPSPRKLDKYRAMELAFGHAGFVPTEFWRCLDWVLKEYYLVRPVQERYTRAKARRILYWVGGDLVPSSIALALDAPLDRVFVEYDSGLRLWVNGSEEPWRVEGKVLPQYGFLALDKDFEAWTAMEPRGRFCVDFCRVGRRGDTDLVFANGRGFPAEREGTAEVTPSVEVEPAGPRRFRITYKFEVGRRGIETLHSRDLTVFVHFVNMVVAQRSDGIVFQHDHKPKVPTAKWEPGTTVVDGPYEVEVPGGVPDAKYEIRLGLYDKEGRVPLLGNDDGSMRYIVGSVIVKGKEVKFEPAKPSMEGVKGRVNFEKIPVDFGYVVTAGMVVVVPLEGEEGLDIIPHPRDAEFEIGLRIRTMSDHIWTHKMHGEAKLDTAKALSADGKVLGTVKLRYEGDIAWLKTVPGTARYRIELPPHLHE